MSLQRFPNTVGKPKKTHTEETARWYVWRYEQKIAVLTGAGISTSAGIPDFRGPDGVWTKHPEQMNVYDIDAFLANKEDREYSWRWQKESPVWNAQPGTAHKALVKLEQAGLLTLLATQNFDALHEKQATAATSLSTCTAPSALRIA